MRWILILFFFISVLGIVIVKVSFPKTETEVEAHIKCKLNSDCEIGKVCESDVCIDDFFIPEQSRMLRHSLDICPEKSRYVFDPENCFKECNKLGKIYNVNWHKEKNPDSIVDLDFHSEFPLGCSMRIKNVSGKYPGCFLNDHDKEPAHGHHEILNICQRHGQSSSSLSSVA